MFNPNVEFMVARTQIPPDGYGRNPRRHEVPTELLTFQYVEHIVTLPRAERAAHLQRMLFQRPRLAADAVRMLGNRASAHDRAMQRYRIEFYEWGIEQETQVTWAITWRFTLQIDINGVTYPPVGTPLNPQPIPPNPLA